MATHPVAIVIDRQDPYWILAAYSEGEKIAETVSTIPEVGATNLLRLLRNKGYFPADDERNRSDRSNRDEKEGI